MRPRLRARASPSVRLRMSISLPSPAGSRISKIGAPAHRKPLIWQIGRKLHVDTTPNGTTAGEWLCTTAVTSGRARIDLAMDEALQV